MFDDFGPEGMDPGGFNAWGAPPPWIAGGLGMNAVQGGIMGGGGWSPFGPEGPDPGGFDFWGGGMGMGEPPMMDFEGSAYSQGGGIIGNRGTGGGPGLNFMGRPRASTSPFSQSPSFGSRGAGGGGAGGGGMGGWPLVPPGGFGSEQANAGAGQAAAALYSQFQSERDRANAANEGRYQGVLSGMSDLYGRSMGALDNMSNQQGADIDRRFRESGAAGQQSLVDRGLGNSTITENFRQGNTEAASAEHRRLADQIAQRRIGLDVDLSGQRFGVMERRTDEAPDMGMLAQLAMQAGAGGAPVMGGGFGGMGASGAGSYGSGYFGTYNGGNTAPSYGQATAGAQAQLQAIRNGNMGARAPGLGTSKAF